MRQRLFSSARTFDTSRADLHPMAFFFLEDLFLTAWRYEAYSTLVVSHLPRISPLGEFTPTLLTGPSDFGGVGQRSVLSDRLGTGSERAHGQVILPTVSQTMPKLERTPVSRWHV